MAEIIVKHKEYEIKFQEMSETWYVMIDDCSYSNVSLKKVKEYIDRLAKKDFKRFKVIYSDWNNKKIGTVTSIDEAGAYWITNDENKERKRITARDIYVYNDKNLTLLSNIKSLKEQIEKLREEIDNLENQIERVK